MGVDRNLIARQQEAQRQQIRSMRLQILRGVETGAATARDRFDNKLRVGSQILWDAPHAMVWQVAAVDVPPEQYWQPGTMQIHLTCRVPLILLPNQPNPQLTLVGYTHPDGVQTELTSPSAMPEGADQAEANRTSPSGLILTPGAQDEVDRDNGGDDGDQGPAQ